MVDGAESRIVFISHSGADTWVARQIASKVSDCGAIPFLDETDIDVGSDFEEDILESLDRAHELVVLLTPWALNRRYVWLEIGAAWGRRIPIVFLLHGLTAAELQNQHEMPVLVKKRNLLALNEIETYLDQLKKRIDSTSSDNSGVCL